MLNSTEDLKPRGNFSFNSTWSYQQYSPSVSGILWSTFLGVVGITTLLSNLLTIAAFTNRRLRRPAHYLLISLACADAMVGAISIPLYICVMLNVFHLNLRSRAIVWFCDFLSGLASVFTLAAISLERLFAMGWPLRHRASSPEAYAAYVTLPWCLAVIVSSLPLFDLLRILPNGILFSTVVFSCSCPILITIISYTILWFKVKGGNFESERNRQKEKRLAVTLVIATVIFVFTWLPYPIILCVINLCYKCVLSHYKTLALLSPMTTFLHLSNSLVNPCIYIFRIPEFRRAIFELICQNRGVRRIGPVRTDIPQRNTLFSWTISSGRQLNGVNLKEQKNRKREMPCCD